MKQCCSVLLFVFINCTSSFSQSDYLINDISSQLRDYRKDVLQNQNTAIGYSFGFSLDLGKTYSSSLRLFANIGFLRKINNGKDFDILIGGQSHVEFFRGGLGSSTQNSNNSKIHIEIRNSLTSMIGYANGNLPTGKPYFVNVNSDASALFDPLDYSLSIGTIFINGINHSRNQRIGTLSFSTNQFMFHYYNDGPPFDFIPLGDAKDRYWTGGGQLGFYFKKDNTLITDLILRFDNYTGYQINLYEVGSLLKIDHLPYIIKKEQFFNQARYQYKLGLKNSIFISGSIYEPIYTDIQNLIHYHISISPFHTRSLNRRFALGVDYNYKPKFQ